MYNLYQSVVWRDIQSKVYNTPFFSINIFGRDYFGIIKKKSFGFFESQRYQIMGVELPDDNSYIIGELFKLKQKYNNKRNNIFFQLGFINKISEFKNSSSHAHEFFQTKARERMLIRDNMKSKFGLKTSFRENMPQCNIVYDITKNNEELIFDMNSGCKERVKKGIKKDVEFRAIFDKEYDEFYDKWIQTSNIKGFNIITKNQYYKLIEYFKSNKTGNLFASYKDGKMLAGSICAFDQNNLIYLYGFADRQSSNFGGHHYLKFKIFEWGRQNGFTHVDMMGGAPTGFDRHPLVGVTRFKESLGGYKIEQYGSYDLVFNKLLYYMFQTYNSIKH